MSDVDATSSLLRGGRAPPARTLVDVFRSTVEQAPDEPALDAGNGWLTYAELAEAADDLAAELNTFGIGRGDKVGVRVSSGTTDLTSPSSGSCCRALRTCPLMSTIRTKERASSSMRPTLRR